MAGIRGAMPIAAIAAGPPRGTEAGDPTLCPATSPLYPRTLAILVHKSLKPLTTFSGTPSSCQTQQQIWGSTAWKSPESPQR
eukprot:6494139-Alexandrium_andersonii.AAC.1